MQSQRAEHTCGQPTISLKLRIANARAVLGALALAALGLGCGPLTEPTPHMTNPVTPVPAATTAPTPAPTAVSELRGSGPGGRAWEHPGAINSMAELEFVKARIKAGDQPWKDEFDRARGSRHASRAPHPLTHLNSGADDANVSRDDATAAYTQALLWAYSGDDVYAQRAIAILNAWSDLQAFTAGSEQDKLQAGWIGAALAPAAEIMRGHPGWAAGDIARLQAMFRRAFYPQLRTASFWNGNVDLTQIDAMLAIAVFNEDLALFEDGITRLKTRSASYFYLSSQDPVPPIRGDGSNVQAFWSKPARWVDGLTQETCRDNGHHAQFALASALHAAETAWHQGVDVYAAERERYTVAMELLALQLTSGSMQGTCASDTPGNTRLNTWEIGYAHYHGRIGIALPNTAQLIASQIRPRSSRTDWNVLWETLTHAGVK